MSVQTIVLTMTKLEDAEPRTDVDVQNVVSDMVLEGEGDGRHGRMR